MKKLQKYQTFCPLFPGFYGTLFEYDSEENEIDYYNEENGTKLGYDDFDWDYSEYAQRISKAFVNRLETEINTFLPIKIEFEKLHSPKEYNFYNDSIWVEVKLNLTDLLAKIKEHKPMATQYFKSHYTSCSGFISFHSPDIEDWLNPKYIKEDTGHRIGALLDCLCHCELDTDDIYYWVEGENYIDFSPKKEVSA